MLLMASILSLSRPPLHSLMMMTIIFLWLLMKQASKQAREKDDYDKWWKLKRVSERERRKKLTLLLASQVIEALQKKKFDTFYLVIIFDSIFGRILMIISSYWITNNKINNISRKIVHMATLKMMIMSEEITMNFLQ